jgi:outer membrane protease
MLIDRHYERDVRFIVDYFEIPADVDYYITVGSRINVDLAYSYFADLEDSLREAYKKHDLFHDKTTATGH